METAFIKSAADGRTLKTYNWRVNDAKGAVQIIHGICEHAGRYDYVAKSLNKAGYAVFSHDHRSFGGSVDAGNAEFSADGHFADKDGWEKAVLDILQVQKQNSVAGQKTFLLAHSMGSFLGQSLMQRNDLPYDAVALSGTRGPVKIKDKIAAALAKFERWRHGLRNFSPLADKLMEQEFNGPFKPNRTPYDWICTDPAVVDAYIADPHAGGKFSTQLACDLSGALIDIYNSGFTNTDRSLPVYLLSGERDPVGMMGKSVKELHSYLKAKGFADLEMNLYPDLRHEVLNEPQKDEVITDLVSWLDVQAAAE